MKLKTRAAGAGLILAGSMLALPAAAQSVDWQQIIGAILGGQAGQATNPNSAATCGSANGQTQVCNIPNGYRAEFLRQVSQAPCINGRTMVITPSTVTVSQGCRAEFRLVASNSGSYPSNGGNGNSGLPISLESAIETALRDRMKAPAGEYSSLYEVNLNNAKSTALRGGASAISGKANSIWGGRTYPIDFSAHVDANGRVTSVDYQYSNPNANQPTQPIANWVRGTAMTTTARSALERAIEAAYRRQSGVRSVQVKTNTLYEQQTAAKNEYKLRGKYGVSLNDGNWQTFGFEARVRAGAATVTQVETGLTP